MILRSKHFPFLTSQIRLLKSRAKNGRLSPRRIPKQLVASGVKIGGEIQSKMYSDLVSPRISWSPQQKRHWPVQDPRPQRMRLKWKSQGLRRITTHGGLSLASQLNEPPIYDKNPVPESCHLHWRGKLKQMYKHRSIMCSYLLKLSYHTFIQRGSSTRSFRPFAPDKSRLKIVSS